MRATPLVLAITLALGLPALPTSGAAAASAERSDMVPLVNGKRTYIVQFEEAPAAAFRGFSADESGRPNLAATSPAVTGATRFDASSAAVVAYRDYLADVRRVRLSDASARLGRSLLPSHVYDVAFNGMAVDLTPIEALRLGKMPGIQSVRPDFVRRRHTERGPGWIQADEIWSGAATGTSRRGEGVVVGVVDGGANPTHIAFAQTSGAFTHTNPYGSFKGLCASAQATCNTKIVGVYDVTTGTGDNETNNGLDQDDGHGVHTASIATGNPLTATITPQGQSGFQINTSGVAPRANLISYKACEADADSSCRGAWLIAGINQAVADGVHVINYSIGGAPTNPWESLATGAIDADEEALLVAREANIVVAAAAGNDGPTPGTLSNPSNSPWVLSVGAVTHDRNTATNPWTSSAALGDKLTDFSGRGPVQSTNIVKPDVTAPGDLIIAATQASTTSMGFKSGTSMATPHVAGAAALLKSLNPAWTASQIISALTLTARATNIVEQDGGAATTPHDRGAGTIDVSLAAKAGLYLDVTGAQFRASNVNAAESLNLPSLAQDDCFESCTLTRTFRLMPGVASGAYSISASLSNGATMTPSSSTISLTGSNSQAINFEFDVSGGAAIGKWVYGHILLTNTSGDGRPNLRLPVAIFSYPGNVPDLFSRSVASERGSFDEALSGIVGLPNARFVGTSLVTPRVDTPTIAQDPSEDDPYDNGTGVFMYLVPIPASPGGGPVTYRVRATTASATAPDIDLFLGLDSNGNGGAVVEEELCNSRSSASDEECFIDVTTTASPQNVWVLAQSWDAGPTSSDVVTIESTSVALAAGDGTLTASGPGNVDSQDGFDLRVSYDDPTFLNGQERTGYVLLQPTAGSTAAVIRVDLTRNAAGYSPFALANNVARSVTLAGGAGQAHDKLYFDVPPHATSVTFTTTSTSNVDLYVARVASPSGPGIAPAPARGSADASAVTGSGNETITLSGGSLPPGRWYVTPANTGGTPATVSVKAQITAQGTPPAFKAGHYFSTARSGHGAFVDFAGPVGNPDQWVMVWYTYLEDTTPTWYYAQGVVPGNPGVWKAELFRVTWNGSAASAVDVGDIVITPTSTNTLTFSFNLDGTSGSESMDRLGDGACSQFNGQPLDVSGHWFSPSLPGFGYSYQVTAGGSPQEVFIPYIYDDQGFPRWVYGQKAFDSAVGDFSLQWFRGFCPTCTAVGLTGTAAGDGTRTLATNNVTNMSVDVNFSGLLSGAWNENRAVALLSQIKQCQ